jgi:uncharacterized YigZ family protein
MLKMRNENSPEMYTTVAQAVRVRIPIGLCRFFASVKEVQTEAEAKEFIDTVSNEFADATHNAWAYKIGFGDRSIRRSSDAGEPANTAGPPMLQAIEGQGLTNVVVVGTRYFGGVKLGVGGLIRAYRDTALAGLEAAGVREEVIMLPVVVNAVDYAYLGDVLREIESCRGNIGTLDYGEQVTIRAQIRPADIDQLQQRITDITRGQASLEVADESCN